MPDENPPRCLYGPQELPDLLRLSSEQVADLENTGQLTAILICGQKRYDSREVDALIDTYLRVAKRRHEHAK